LFQELRSLEQDRTKNSSLPLHPREVRQILERIRESRGSQIGYLKKRGG